MPLHSPRAACIGLAGMNSMRPPYCTTCMGMPVISYMASRMCLGVTTWNLGDSASPR